VPTASATAAGASVATADVDVAAMKPAEAAPIMSGTATAMAFVPADRNRRGRNRLAISACPPAGTVLGGLRRPDTAKCPPSNYGRREYAPERLPPASKRDQ
jgi:hypothetical protein